MSAWIAIIDIVTIANVQFGLSTPSPKGVLDEPRKVAWIICAKNSRVDPTCNFAKDVGTTIFGIARASVRMFGPEFVDDSSSTKKIMH